LLVCDRFALQGNGSRYGNGNGNGNSRKSNSSGNVRVIFARHLRGRSAGIQRLAIAARD
jgi:hypothetical protein